MPTNDVAAARAWLAKYGPPPRMEPIQDGAASSATHAEAKQADQPPGAAPAAAPGQPTEHPAAEEVSAGTPGPAAVQGPAGALHAAASAYHAERAERERIRRERDQMALDQARGSVLHVDDAARAAATVFRGLRDQLLNIGPRLKDQLAAETDPVAVEAAIEGEVRAVLSGFNVAAAVREPDDADDTEDADA